MLHFLDIFFIEVLGHKGEKNPLLGYCRSLLACIGQMKGQTNFLQRVLKIHFTDLERNLTAAEDDEPRSAPDR